MDTLMSLAIVFLVLFCGYLWETVNDLKDRIRYLENRLDLCPHGVEWDNCPDCCH